MNNLESKKKLKGLKNIVEQGQAEEKLKELNQILENIGQGIKGGVFLLSKDFKILWANKAIVKQTGYKMEKLLGDYCYRVTHHRDSPCKPPFDPCPIYSLKKTGKPATINHTYLDKKGNKIFVEVSAYPIKDERGRIVKFVHMTRNLTKWKKLEEMYRNIVELSPVGITTFNKEGTIISCNSASAEMLGYSKNEIIGKHFTKIGSFRMKDLPKYIRLFSSVIKGKINKPLEVEFHRKDGTSFLAEVRISPMKKDGKIIGFQAISRDITERKKVEEALKQRNLELERFNKLAINRELKMIELKKKIKQLKKQIEELKLVK